MVFPPKGTGKMLLIGAAAFVALAVVASIFAPDGPPGDPIGAYVFCENVVEDRLRAPATAQFAGYNEEDVAHISEGVWRVESYVDAQNGFGAMLRSDWSCEVLSLGDGWELMSLDFDTR